MRKLFTLVVLLLAVAACTGSPTVGGNASLDEVTARQGGKNRPGSASLSERAGDNETTPAATPGDVAADSMNINNRGGFLGGSGN